MLAVITLLSVVAVSIIIVRIAAIALMLTGLSRDVARFQARSALSGTGFTTTESEMVVNHPLRRRIITILIILKNAGLITAVAALILTFMNTGTADIIRRSLLLIGGLILLLFLSKSAYVESLLSRVIQWALRKFTKLDVQDYLKLLNLRKDFEISTIKLENESWLSGKKIADSELRNEGVMILGLTRKDGKYIGVPRGKYQLHAGEELVLYGNKEDIAKIKDRIKGRWGDREHDLAVEEHRDELAEQDQSQKKYQSKQQTMNDG